MMMREVKKEGGLLDVYGEASLLLEDLKPLKDMVSEMKTAAEDFRKVAQEIKKIS